MDKLKYTIFNIIILILGALALMVGYNWNKVPMPGLNNIPAASSTIFGNQ